MKLPTLFPHMVVRKYIVRPGYDRQFITMLGGSLAHLRKGAELFKTLKKCSTISTALKLTPAGGKPNRRLDLFDCIEMVQRDSGSVPRKRCRKLNLDWHEDPIIALAMTPPEQCTLSRWLQPRLSPGIPVHAAATDPVPMSLWTPEHKSTSGSIPPSGEACAVPTWTTLFNLGGSPSMSPMSLTPSSSPEAYLENQRNKDTEDDDNGYNYETDPARLDLLAQFRESLAEADDYIGHDIIGLDEGIGISDGLTQRMFPDVWLVNRQEFAAPTLLDGAGTALAATSRIGSYLPLEMQVNVVCFWGFGPVSTFTMPFEAHASMTMNCCCCFSFFPSSGENID